MTAQPTAEQHEDVLTASDVFAITGTVYKLNDGRVLSSAETRMRDDLDLLAESHESLRADRDRLLDREQALICLLKDEGYSDENIEEMTCAQLES